MGEAPLAPSPAAHPSQLERLWRTWASVAAKRPSQLVGKYSCAPGSCGTGNSLTSSLQQQLQSCLLELSPAPPPSWAAFRPFNLLFFFFFKVGYQETASGRLSWEMGLKGEAGQILQLTDKNKSTAETNSSTHFKEGKKKINKPSFKEDLFFSPSCRFLGVLWIILARNKMSLLLIDCSVLCSEDKSILQITNKIVRRIENRIYNWIATTPTWK